MATSHTYPFQIVGEADALTPAQLDTLVRLDQRSGPGKTPPSTAIGAHLARQKTQAKSAGIVADTWIRKWMHGVAAKQTPPPQIIDYMLELARRGTSQTTLERAQAVINELGWLPEGARHLRDVLTQSFVNQLLAKGAK